MLAPLCVWKGCVIAEPAGGRHLVSGERESGSEREREEVAEVIRRVIALIEESRSIPRAFNSLSSSCFLKIDCLCSLLSLLNCSYGNPLWGNTILVY